MLTAFLHGYLLAFGLILPLGPQNAFIFAQGASQPRLVRALPAALSAAVSDTLLILLAVLGVSVIILTLPWFRTALVVFGVGFLLVIGWLTWRTTPRAGDDEVEAERWPARRQVMFALSVSLLNPHAILDTIGVIGTSSLSYAAGPRMMFTLACILNSWLWFLGLMVAGRLVGNFKGVRMWLNRASAVVMWISAVYLAASLL